LNEIENDQIENEKIRYKSLLRNFEKDLKHKKLIKLDINTTLKSIREDSSISSTNLSNEIFSEDYHNLLAS
jgi:hypothetical protein